MIKILATGIKIENNFGGPSILHGVQEVLNELYGDDYELNFFQTTHFNKYQSRDFNFKIQEVPFLKENFGFTLLRNKEMKDLIREVRSSDIVVDLLGICFSDNFHPKKYNSWRINLGVLYSFRVLTIAKFFGKKTVKNTCSFGPMKTKMNQKAAAFACKYLFDVIAAREIKSREALISDAEIKKEVLLSPDIANMMNFSRNPNSNRKVIGISTSHQIIRQWEGEEEYIHCIVNLCRHIAHTLNSSIILIPNEVQPMPDFNDVTVSLDIQDKLQRNGIQVDVVDSEHITSTELKNIVASCEVIIASRYHSCVAALSSGVPTLVIGWHYKYEELLRGYGQEKWGIPTKDCSSEKLITTFDSFWESRNESKRIIAEKYPDVRKRVLEAGKILFSK